MYINPSRAALMACEDACEALESKNLSSFRISLSKVFCLRHSVERTDSSWEGHVEYTEALLQAAALCSRAGYVKLAFRIAKRAQAWADDPMLGGNSEQFHRSIEIQKLCERRVFSLIKLLQSRW